ncbi:hypothetical protein SAMN05216548_11327 [Faunimonas pinastri]|uniref:DUF6456 domain-containing protein n=1 Tax=Faunimonas pinastri TaxID=1855383 RepID=A0A1H9M9Y1_9HYPH|nr:DUF6456 domain-containing protein [Faunimonas pinastri]SER20494.1 hypothetical protein SAMN05216548_11327 [Faunimonas pinastri]
MADRSVEAAIGRLLGLLCGKGEASLHRTAGGAYRLMVDGMPRQELPALLVDGLVSRGLLRKSADGVVNADASAISWLRRNAKGGNGEGGEGGASAYLSQHVTLGRERILVDDRFTTVTVDRDESPVATLARRKDRDGSPFLSPAAVQAGERLRSDFERGQMRPSVTASWSPTPKASRRSGDAGGVGDLTDAALAARIRFQRALDAIDPGFVDIAVDVCCFLKGLEAVEKDGEMPARSAKVVLRMALDALARHYGLSSLAEGRSHSRTRHWGTDDYRPLI